MKKILIIGASGFVGSHLTIHLREDFSLFGTYYKHKPLVSGIKSLYFPILFDCNFMTILQAIKPHAVIYCATNSEPSALNDANQSAFLNTQVPVGLAQALERKNIYFIYLSSAEVFWGSTGDYNEDDRTEPKTMLGMAKAHAENGLELFDNAAILRTGTLFGLGSRSHNAFLNKILCSLRDQSNLPLVSDEYRSFIFIDDLCRAIKYLVSHTSRLEGLYHFSQSEKHSHFSFARTVASVFNLPHGPLHPMKGVDYAREFKLNEPRSKDLTLNGTLLLQKLPLSLTPVEEAIVRIKENLRLGTQ